MKIINKVKMKNKAMCNFHWGKYLLKMIDGSDSYSTGPDNVLPMVTIESEEPSLIQDLIDSESIPQ